MQKAICRDEDTGIYEYSGVEFIPAPEGDSYEIGGKQYPVHQYVQTAGYGIAPLVDIPMMSDYHWQKMCLDDRLKNPEKYSKNGEDVPATISKLTEWLIEHADECDDAEGRTA